MTPLLTGVFASQISGHLDTFTPTGSYDALASYTVPSGGVSEITFAGLPTGGQYTHLQVRGILRSTRALTQAGVLFRLNSDTGSNYSWHVLVGDGSNDSAEGYANQTYIKMGELPAGSASSDIFGAFVVDILDYQNTNKYKTVRLLTGQDRNGAGEVSFLSGNWRNTNAITSISIKEDISNMAQFSQVSIYGIRG